MENQKMPSHLFFFLKVQNGHIEKFNFEKILNSETWRLCFLKTSIPVKEVKIFGQVLCFAKETSYL